MQPLTVSEYIKENTQTIQPSEYSEDQYSMISVEDVEEMCRMIRSGRLINDMVQSYEYKDVEPNKSK